MKKERLKGILIGGIIMGTIYLGVNPSIAQTISKTISVVFNDVNIVLDGKKVDADNILYNGTTYVPMRKMAEMIEKEVNWNQATKTANIGVTGNNQSKENNKEWTKYYGKQLSSLKFHIGQMDKVMEVVKEGIDEERIITFMKNVNDYKKSNFIDKRAPVGYESIHNNMINSYKAYESTLLNMLTALRSVKYPESEDLYNHLLRADESLNLSIDFMLLASDELESKK